MTDADTLLIALAGFYLFECILWIPENCLAFVSRFDRHWHWILPTQCFGNQRGGLLLLNPLPPLGGVFLCPSSTAANMRLVTAPGSAVRDALDATAIVKRVEEYHEHTRCLRPICNVLWVCLFVAAPLMLRIPRAGRYLGVLLFACAMQVVAIAISYYNAHRRLYPEEKQGRQLAMIALFPPATMRAQDTLSRQLLTRFHPLAVASVLCPKPDFHRFAHQLILELRHPLSITESTENPYELQMLQALEGFCAKAGLNLQELESPPAALDETCRSYCPRCRTQYTTIDGECADCAGIKLLQL